MHCDGTRIGDTSLIRDISFYANWCTRYKGSIEIMAVSDVWLIDACLCGLLYLGFFIDKRKQDQYWWVSYMSQHLVHCCLNLCVVHLILILAYHGVPLILYFCLLHVFMMMKWDMSPWFLHQYILPSTKFSRLYLGSVAIYSFPSMNYLLA